MYTLNNMTLQYIWSTGIAEAFLLFFIKKIVPKNKTKKKTNLSGDEGLVEEGTHGRIERPYPVLLRPHGARAVVHPVLHPNRGIDEREQSRRHADERHPPTVERGSHANDVQQHPTTDGKDGLAATETEAA